MNFAKWVAKIGDGTEDTYTEYGSDVKILDDILLRYEDDPIGAIVNSIYPDLGNVIDHPEYFHDRVILAPTLDVVNSINKYMIGLNGNEMKSYFNYDSACKLDANVDMLADVHTPEFLNIIRCSGVPNHELNLKVGTPIMLLRNIDHSRDLCNGTRLLVTNLGKHVLHAKLLIRSNADEVVLIPRFTLMLTDVRLLFKIQRGQFPVIVSYAMTINKSKDQSLANVGLFLRRPVFSHDQLYVTVSRSTTKAGLKILLDKNNDSDTGIYKNYVLREVFRNV